MMSLSILKGKALEKVWEEDMPITVREGISFGEVSEYIRKKQEQEKLYGKYCQGGT